MKEDWFTCPKCGFESPSHDECLKCGIIFSKYKSADVRPLPKNSIPEGTSSKSRIAPHDKGTQPAFIRLGFPLLVICSAMIILGGYVYWHYTDTSKSSVRYQAKKVELLRNNRAQAYRDFMQVNRALESQGQIDIYYGDCNASGLEVFVALLNDIAHDRFNEIAGCIIRFPDVSVITPVLNWFASLDLNRQRATENDLKTVFLKIGEPAVETLIENLNTLENAKAAALTAQTLALINSNASINALVELLEKGSQKLEPIPTFFIETVLSSNHLNADRAFHLAVSLSQNTGNDTRLNVAKCMAVFEGEPVRIWAIAGTLDPDKRISKACRNLLDQFEMRKRQTLFD
ncbi:MAG: hypothetical protein KJ737_11605 [Proteobacteria bacterium]|nr:hypothetical protein [Pseudomonadota bacterium]